MISLIECFDLYASTCLRTNTRRLLFLTCVTGLQQVCEQVATHAVITSSAATEPKRVEKNLTRTPSFAV